MKYTEVKEPRWGNAEKTVVISQVLFEEIGDWIPFAATASDFEEHGREIFARCIAKEFGTIGPLKTNTTEALAFAKQEKQERLLEAQSVLSPLEFAERNELLSEVEDTALQSLREYTLAVSRIENSVGYPHSITWPTRPY